MCKNHSECEWLTSKDLSRSRPIHSGAVLKTSLRGKEGTVNGEGLFASCIQQHKENEKGSLAFLIKKIPKPRKKS